jgi:hypothetical protein
MEKQEIFDLMLKYPNAMEFYKVMHNLVWEWHKNGEVLGQIKNNDE